MCRKKNQELLKLLKKKQKTRVWNTAEVLQQQKQQDDFGLVTL